MSTDGILEYQGTKRVLYRGDTSNIVFDTRTTSLGIGVTGSNNPSSNLYITGNAYVSSNLAIGGVMTMGVVNVAARHNLQAVTDMGNVTTHTIEFTNPTTSLVASGNVEVGGNVEVAKELTVSGNVEITKDLYYSGMIRNLEYMEDTIRSWNPDYWWDLNDTDYLEGGVNEGDGISYVHNKSGNWVDNYLTATNCYTKYINGRRFWTGNNTNSRMESRDKDDFGGPGIGDLTSIFHVACTSPSELNRDYYHDSFTNDNRSAVAWDTWGAPLDGDELILTNGNQYGYNDGNTKTAGGILGTNSSDTTRSVHCLMTKANNAFPSARGGATQARGINNHISIATLTRGTLTTNLANVTNDPGGNVADAIVWGNRHTHDRHNVGDMFYAEMIVFKRNRGIISQAQVKFLQDYFRFKYQVGGAGLQYSG